LHPVTAVCFLYAGDFALQTQVTPVDGGRLDQGKRVAPRVDNHGGGRVEGGCYFIPEVGFHSHDFVSCQQPQTRHAVCRAVVIQARQLGLFRLGKG
jgi:hypothetical protein